MRISLLSGAAVLFLLSACGDQNPAAPTFTPAAEPSPVLLDGLASIRTQFSSAVITSGSNLPPAYCGGVSQSTCASLGLATPPLVQVRWGTPGSGTSRSGLGFQATSEVAIETNTEFNIGTLTHFNFPVFGGVSSVTLTFSVVLPGTSGFTANFPVRFDVEETPNSSPCTYVTTGPLCADRISWALPQPSAITQNGNVYALNIKGFRTSASASSPALNGFISDEGEETQAFLFAEVADATAQTHAIDDSYSVEVGGVLTVAPNGVRLNDTPDVVSVMLATGPEHGTLTLAPTGGFTYTPAAGFGGEDSFVYFGRRSNGELSLATVTIHVLDTTAPTLMAPASIVLEATSSSGAVASWTDPVATDAVDGSIPATCASASGSTFPLGTTTVTCTATDAAGNSSSASFTVTVQDTTAPGIAASPDILFEATSAAGAVVSWTPIMAQDLVDGAIAATCSRASGTTFPLGATAVTCTAADASGNTTATSFQVRVEDHTAPALSLPANIVLYPLNPSGATATWTATALDLVSGAVPVTCNPASGSFFPAATTKTVSCSASDAAGNTATGSFTVRVRTIEELLDLLVQRSVGLRQGRNLEQLSANIRSSFLRGSEPASCGQLGAYLAEISAQSASLPAVQAAELSALATLVRQVIGC